MSVRLFKPQTRQKGNQFYRELTKGKFSNYIWGKKKRFDPVRLNKSPSIYKFFTSKVVQYITLQDKVLDIGCGSGVFLPVLSPMCRQLVGLDISRDMLKETIKSVSLYGFQNIFVVNAGAQALPFADNEFDVLVLVDAIHHIDDVEGSIAEIKRVVKPQGKVLIFEPNKLNPLLWFLCMLDQNEWGALNLGSKRKYIELFKSHFSIELMEYNGLLIGPDSPVSRKIVDFITAPIIKYILDWLSPKIFMVMTVKHS
ncbi:MAG: class I SAM-dependent methyltransferase [Smithellaceae bacterium]